MKEVNAYYKMLKLIFEIAEMDNMVVKLNSFHKLWTKYYAKEFRRKKFNKHKERE